jgi:hypothetical protein
MVAAAPIVTLCLCALVSIAAVVIGAIALDKSLHIPLNYVSPSPASSPAFQTQIGSTLSQDNTDFFPLTPQTLTYATPFKSNPFLILNTVSQLSGRPCTSQIISENLTQFQSQIFNCPANGFIVNQVANNVINPSIASFTVGTSAVPAVLYALNAELFYQLAKDSAGIFWNDPVLVASVPLNATKFKLLNVNGQPTAAWVDNTNKFYFAQATTVDWSAYAVGPIAVTPGYNLSTTVFDFLYVNGQPSVVVENTATNDINFIRSLDDGATWVTTTLIVAATAMSTVSANIVNGFPAVMGVTTLGAMNFYRSVNNIGGVPWTASVVYGAGISNQNLTLDNVTVSTVSKPIIWAADATHQVFLVADDVNGLTWTSANEVRVNSLGSGTSQNGHMIVNNSTNLLISYIDQSFQLQYMVVTSSDFSTATNGANASPIDPGVLHLDQSSNIALIGTGIAFIYVRGGKLLYFRPPLGTQNTDTQYLTAYTAIGST